MRELPQDRPYRFRPPMVRPWLRPLLDVLNRRVFLERLYNVSSIECHGVEALRDAVRAGEAVMLAPNHADHADVHVMYEVTSRVGVQPLFMGAREIFEAGWWNSFALQSAGVFSVDRDGADIAAIKTALGILEAGKNPLVIYPEGEIYHHHEWLDPLHDGLASILLRVAKKLPESRKALVFPVAFRFTYDASVAATFPARLSALETAISWKPKNELSTVERIHRLGMGLLAVKETEFFGEAGSGPLAERLEQLRERLLGSVEERHGKDAKAETVPERVRAQRYRIRRKLLDDQHPPSTAERHAMLDDIKRVHLAYQIYSYPGVYLAENPSDDRIAETIMKMEEDLLGKAGYPIARTARITFGEPLNVTALLRNGTLPEQNTALALTARLEDRLRSMLRGDAPDVHHTQ